MEQLVTFSTRHALIKLQHPPRHSPPDSVVFDAINHHTNCFALLLFCFVLTIHPPFPFLPRINSEDNEAAIKLYNDYKARKGNYNVEQILVAFSVA